MSKKIIIIGGGMSGLVSAVYAKHCGFDVTLYEKNANLGGCCCGWERKGNYIDGCIHWLQGTKNDGGVLHEIWETVGALGNRGIINPKSFLDFDVEGTVFHWYNDPVKLKEEMLRVAPEDTKRINAFFRKLKTYIDFPMPTQKPTDLFNIFELIKIGLTLAVRYSKMVLHSHISVEDYGKKFKSPVLRKVFAGMMPPRYNLMSAFYMMGVLASGDGGIPVGGSQAVTDRVVARAKGLGCKIFTGCGVERIIIEKDTAKGVLLKNGTEDFADYVISTTDATYALEKMLGGKYHVHDFAFRNRDRKTYPLYTYTLAAIKVNADTSTLFHDAVIERKVEMGTPVETVSLRNYAYDPTLRGADGSTVIQAQVIGMDEMYDYWKAQRETGNYKARKAEVGRELQAILEDYYPQLRGKTEVIDVVTPLTYERYLNTRNGTFQGYVSTPESKTLSARNYIPELKNFVFSGQWLMRCGGLPPAAFLGRFAVQRICDWEKIPFYGSRRGSLLRQLRNALTKKQRVR